MIIHDVVQGSPAWDALRASTYRTGSVAPAMMGCHKQIKRTELLRMAATGDQQEFSDWVRENILERGHQYEAAARPIAEKIIGEDLYPSTVSSDDGYLLASLDGLTMLGDVLWEHKQPNADLLAAVRAGECPDYHYWQLVQGFAITDAERALFMVSDGTEENEAHVWVERNEADIAKLMASWKQFDEDLKTFTPEPAAAPIVVADIDALPALQVELAGSVVSSNLVVWRDAVSERIRAINTDLQSDEDFAVAEKTVKFLDDGEKRLDLVKTQALAQTASIDELFRAIDSLREDMRAKRLQLDKLVKSRKESIRAEILQSGVGELAEHIRTLNQRIGKPYMPQVPADFAGVMKGKKTVASLKDAVNTEAARAKVEASAIADRIQINMNSLREMAGDHVALFPDTAQIVLKANDDLVALIKTRIAEHVEAKRKEEEATRERIRAEEQEKAEKAAREKLELEKRLDGAQAREDARQAEIAGAVLMTRTADAAQTSAKTPDNVTAITPAQIQDTGARLKLGEMCSMLGFTVTAEFLQQIGFPPAAVDKNARLYRAADFPAICAALARHAMSVGNSFAQKVA